jgi:hypothetical protein
MGEMVGPPTIEFCSQFWANGQSLLSLRVGQAFPQRDRKVSSFVRREAEQIGERRRHMRILALGLSERN